VTTKTKAGDRPVDADIPTKRAMAMATDTQTKTEKIAQSAGEGVSIAQAGQEQAQADFGTMQSKVKVQMDKAIKTVEELVAFGQGNFEAFVRASQIWSSGVQDLSKQVAAHAQSQLDETVSTWKALTSVKSLKEAIDLHSSLARTSVEKALSETNRLTDASLKLAEQVSAPLSARVSLAVEKFARVG
jgi:phasin family protein